MAVWKYNKKEIKNINDIPEGCFGFVYIITKPDGQYYVGRKNIFSTTKLKPLKGQKRKRIVTKESNWSTYQSSNKDVQSWNSNEIDKEILHWAFSKIELTYYEYKAQFCLGVLEDINSLNGNIAGKIYKDHILKK